jgi:hypothetical protein
MPYCPNCSCPLEPNEGDCPKCGALFGPNAAWAPTAEPSGPVPVRPERTTPPSIIAGTSTKERVKPSYVPGRIGWANLSLAIAFLLSFYLSPGAKALRILIDLPVLQSIPAYKAHVLNAFASYWVIAILVYLGLRFTRAELWLRPRPAIHALIGVGNSLLIIYLIPRIFASSIEGGGPSFVVAMFSPYFVIPAKFLFLIGFLWLAARSISKRKEVVDRQRFTRPEYAVLTLVLGIPAAYASTLYFGQDAPFRMAREAGQVFELKCKLAGERILRKPTEDVKGLFLERDGGDYFQQIKDGVYNGSGSGILGEPLVNSGLLMFTEKPNDRPRPEDGGQFKYRRHGFKDWKGQPVNEFESEYGVYRKELTTEAERRLGLRGAEIAIKDLRTNEVLATTTYFVSSRQRKFCGEASDGNFGVSQFVRRALDLKRSYPSARDDRSPAKK